MSNPAQFDAGDDFTTKALMARARGGKVAEVLPPGLRKLIEVRPHQKSLLNNNGRQRMKRCKP